MVIPEALVGLVVKPLLLCNADFFVLYGKTFVATIRSIKSNAAFNTELLISSTYPRLGTIGTGGSAKIEMISSIFTAVK